MAEPSRSIAPRRLPSRYATLPWIAALFLAVNALVRAALLALEVDAEGAVPAGLAGMPARGLVYDLAATSWLLAPFVLLALRAPDRPRAPDAQPHRPARHGLVFTQLYATGLRTGYG
jgi:hypothetical protein